MQEIGRLLLVAGIALCAIGTWLLLGPQLPWWGRLPGDIHIERPQWRLHFPIATCLVISLVLTIAFHLWSRWR